MLVNAVAPGPVETPLWLGEGGLAEQAAEAQGSPREEVLEAARAKIPLGRFGTEEEIAAVVAFLCSERASNVTGAAWSVDGGGGAHDRLSAATRRAAVLKVRLLTPIDLKRVPPIGG